MPDEKLDINAEFRPKLPSPLDEPGAKDAVLDFMAEQKQERYRYDAMKSALNDIDERLGELKRDMEKADADDNTAAETQPVRERGGVD